MLRLMLFLASATSFSCLSQLLGQQHHVESPAPRYYLGVENMCAIHNHPFLARYSFWYFLSVSKIWLYVSDGIK